jgi:hypothetical protein
MGACYGFQITRIQSTGCAISFVQCVYVNHKYSVSPYSASRDNSLAGSRSVAPGSRNSAPPDSVLSGFPPRPREAPRQLSLPPKNSHSTAVARSPVFLFLATSRHGQLSFVTCFESRWVKCFAQYEIRSASGLFSSGARRPPWHDKRRPTVKIRFAIGLTDCARRVGSSSIHWTFVYPSLNLAWS